MRLVNFCCAAALATIISAVPAWAQTSSAPAAPAPERARTLTRFRNATEVQLRDVAAFVRVIPENRTDVAIGWVNTGATPAPGYRMSRHRLIVDGNLRRQIRSCRVNGSDGFEVETTRLGRLTGAALPVIELRVPQNAVVAASGALRVHVAPAQALDIRLDGCGDADIVRVEDEAEIAISGSQDVRMYEAGQVSVAIAGSGDVVLGAVHNGLTLSVAGSGDVTAANVDGPTSIAIQGSGDVNIRDGHATSLSVVIAGGGDVTHGGAAETLDAVILGGGDVRVRRVDGEITRRVLGGGEVVIGR
ncbi:GIN domain-containing protein [Candidatus Viadribacter manganicus]|uniref:Putative auto-transporter adhesin head GIN domain-containing protein n=1 Tax=Candidatus Viadribacter manganicus TaxID=1759059 RepID=A0A1B1AK77_9PROT|nr:DUF2807 domain-containing protein [Candidatus Viadribacter manganicus]ANP46976.1 hypothetical protein ATE48_14150 [Candidatus Viadribacter manganicus]